MFARYDWSKKGNHIIHTGLVGSTGRTRITADWPGYLHIGQTIPVLLTDRTNYTLYLNIPPLALFWRSDRVHHRLHFTRQFDANEIWRLY